MKKKCWAKHRGQRHLSVSVTMDGKEKVRESKANIRLKGRSSAFTNTSEKKGSIKEKVVALINKEGKRNQ